MPIDRIKYIALKIPEGNLVCFRAGKLKYISDENSYRNELIDGEKVYQLNWLHLAFSFSAGYLNQQVLSSEEPALNIELVDQLSLGLYNAEVTMKVILDALVSGSAEFFPRLVDQYNNYDFTKYAVLPDQDAVELFNARENGRFPMQTQISLTTKNPLYSYPSWINR